MTIDYGQGPRLAALFARRKLMQKILMYLAYVPVIFALYVRWKPDFTLGGLSWGPLFGMGLGLGVILVFASYMFWRCPNCNKFLGLNRRAVSCKHCNMSFVKTPKSST